MNRNSLSQQVQKPRQIELPPQTKQQIKRQGIKKQGNPTKMISGSYAWQQAMKRAHRAKEMKFFTAEMSSEQKSMVGSYKEDTQCIIQSDLSTGTIKELRRGHIDCDMVEFIQQNETWKRVVEAGSTTASKRRQDRSYVEDTPSIILLSPSNKRGWVAGHHTVPSIQQKESTKQANDKERGKNKLSLTLSSHPTKWDIQMCCPGRGMRASHREDTLCM